MDSDRTRPRSYTVARTASPRSHNSETMTKLARYHGKSTGYCNNSDTLEVVR